ncbi:MAG: hypothetical protein HQ521_18825 [Bacteroidetes bacterium]|nr:hypothetical protein [Bacteroidota bacterium]
MNKIIILVISLLLCNSVIGQEKKISGKVFNNLTNQNIAGVIITPSFNNDTILSDSNGRFSIHMPKSYYNTLVFKHPDFYPYVKRINRESRLKFNFIPLLPITLELDTVCYLAYKGNRVLNGKITDSYKDELLPNATISLCNIGKVAVTNNSGGFSVVIPEEVERVIISHPEFKPDTILVKRGNQKIRNLEAGLVRKKLSHKDTLWLSNRNITEIAISELVFGAFGVGYQRFLKTKHAIGIHTSYYFNGNLPGFNFPDSEFRGIKVAPYYRYYEKRNERKSSFIEVKFITGYFDFHKLYYAWKVDSRDGDYASVQFSSYGFGAGFGWSTLLPRSKHIILTISGGFQVFPTHVPRTIEHPGYGTLYVKDLAWYIVGPGSGVEFKISIGGIF